MSENKNSGFDIDLGNLCSKDAFEWAKTTFKNRENKAGSIALKVDGVFSNMLIFGNQRIGIGSDGIGTKIELAERTGIYDTLGYDLVAMVADDLATAGFEPTSISNIIDVDVLDRDIINDLMRGLADACHSSGISITGGEIAELGPRINGYGTRMHFNWCSTAIGVLPENMEKPIDGSEVKAGMAVVALRSRGFRSNGFSLLRKIMHQTLGENWHNESYNEDQTWGQALLTPSLIYCKLINSIIVSGIIPKGAAHITGGGIADNFRRVLKTSSCGAVLDQLFEPLELMKRVMELGKVSEEDAYQYWNMGNGMLLVVEESEVEPFVQIAAEAGFMAQRAGSITSSSEIIIQTKSKELIYSY